MPTSRCSTKPLKVKLLAGEQKATECCILVGGMHVGGCDPQRPRRAAGQSLFGRLPANSFRSDQHGCPESKDTGRKSDLQYLQIQYQNEDPSIKTQTQRKQARRDTNEEVQGLKASSPVGMFQFPRSFPVPTLVVFSFEATRSLAMG